MKCTKAFGIAPLRHKSLLVALFAAMLLPACTFSTGSFDEPGLRGKLIDAETSQPLQGAVVYGYYATAEGSLGGGETIKEILRVFEVESNAEGIFEIPAWKSSWPITRGEPRQRFPAIAIYKDGYKLDLQNLSSISAWVSPTKLPGEPTRTGNVIDWTAAPAQLKPTKTERERYDALKNTNYAYAEKGNCGWEQHVKLLLAQHAAVKQWVRRNVPSDQMGVDGLPKGSWRPENGVSAELIYYPTAVERVVRAYEKAPNAWKCSGPDAFLTRGEK